MKENYSDKVRDVQPFLSSIENNTKTQVAFFGLNIKECHYCSSARQWKQSKEQTIGPDMN